MKTRIVRGEEVRRLLTMEECIEAMRAALRDVSSGDGTMLQRGMLPLSADNKFALMGGADLQTGLCGAKVIVFPGAEAARRHTSQGVIPLFDCKTGGLAAIVDAEQITAVRTAAASAVDTGLLARKSASSLAILGAGRIGRMHIEASAWCALLRQSISGTAPSPARRSAAAKPLGWGCGRSFAPRRRRRSERRISSAPSPRPVSPFCWAAG